MLSERTNSHPSILLVDDDANLRLIGRQSLQKKGLLVTEACDGEDALQILETRSFDLIISDIMMPKMDGFTLCEKVKQSDFAQKIPIIVLTGLNDFESIEKAYIVGATDFAIKPVNWTVLSHRIRYILRSIETSSKIQHMLYYDDLTGLNNQHAFEEYLEKAIEHSTAIHSSLGVLVLNIDQFKRINDALGYQYKNILLQAFTSRLQKIFRNYLKNRPDKGSQPYSAMLAYFGGDEFAIVLPNLTDVTEAATVATAFLKECKEPLILSEQEVFLTVSIGISIYPLDAKKSITLIQHATAALHYANEDGWDNFKFFSKLLNVKARHQMALESSLRNALEKQELFVYLQAKFAISDKKITGAEALLRWKSPEHGTVSPVDFIPIAEQTGLIVPIGYFVLQTVCAKLREWLDKGEAEMKIAINLSGVQLKEEQFLEMLVQIVDAYQIPHHLIELEITESILMENLENALVTLQKCNESHFPIAIDDFGTGYSSLNYLRRLSATRLKIDKSFISDVISNKDNQAIVKAVIAMSHNLGLQVTAEGIETEEQLKFLKDNHCDEGQGFLLYKPVSIEEFENSLK